MKKIILLVLAMALTFSSCEKDDICDANTSTTPRLVIRFFDVNNASVAKNVTNLTIIGENLETGISFGGSTIINGNTVSIPLQTDVDVTTFRFILNFGNQNPAVVNEDIIRLNYTRKNQFVSRACGFKTTFTLDPVTPFVHTDVATNDGKWINTIAVKNSSIETENETHLEIFF
jgi:hypothetical protein